MAPSQFVPVRAKWLCLQSSVFSRARPATNTKTRLQVADVRSRLRDVPLAIDSVAVDSSAMQYAGVIPLQAALYQVRPAGEFDTRGPWDCDDRWGANSPSSAYLSVADAVASSFISQATPAART